MDSLTVTGGYENFNMNAAILNFVFFAAFNGTSGGLSGQAIAVVLVGLAALTLAT